MSEERSIPCGPFEIVEPIGEGGMGAVYRARHDRDGTDVAIKVMTLDRATDLAFRRAFRREAQALARLNHPHIATVYDFGTVDDLTAARGPEPFRPGAPWFAMEYVEGTPLGKIAGIWTWPELEEFLFAILDALAHAHAREVLHRDLTPSNILVEYDGGPGQIELVDFGVARLAETGDDSGEEPHETVRGTPRYMAPEQILGERREQGPWTDLYALGCLTWRVVCGEPAVEGDTTEEMFRAHFEGVADEFTPRFSVPSAFEPWLRGLLDRRPARRCRRAADAAWELMQMTPPDDYGADRSLDSTWEGGEMPTLATVRDVDSVGEALEAGEMHQFAKTVEESEPIPTWSPDEEAQAVDRETLNFSAPPTPARWRRETDDRDETPLSGSGLELFALRRLPLVDRVKERDLLWHSLRQVKQDQRPAAVLMAGPPGSGKSRLAEWLAERAHEVGVATTLRATHSVRGGPEHGIGAALIRHFQCRDMEWSEALNRLTDTFEALDVPRETALVDAVGILKMAGWGGESSEAERVVGFQSPDERNATLARLLGRLAERTRPLVLRLDDVARSRESVAFVHHVMTSEQCRDLPVLLVMTARTGEWHGSDPLQDLFGQGDDDRRRLVSVGPLEPEDHRELVRRMLRFDEELIEDVVDRTEGHPLFAVQLVQSWVDAGKLAVENGAFVLEADDEQLPEDLERLWGNRIDQVLSRIRPEERDDAERSLELAATLGKQVDNAEWRAVCERAGVAFHPRVPEQMATSGLARHMQNGWEFIHGMLAESLLNRAERHGRLADHHAICAGMLETVYPNQLDQTAERRAEHWLEAGRPERALDPLLRAARHLADHRGDLRRSTELLEERAGLIDRNGLPDDDRRRVENRLELAANLLRQGGAEEAAEMIRPLEDVIEANDWPRLTGEWHRLTVRLATNRGDYDAAADWIDSGEEAFRRAGDDRGLARTLMLRGLIAARTERMGRAIDIYERARDICERIGYTVGGLRVRKDIAWWRLERQELEPAAEIAKELVAEARSHRARILEADAFNILGEIARRREEWSKAVRLYERSQQLWREGGSRYAVLVEINIALVQAEAGRWSNAETVFRRLQETLPAHGFETRLLCVHLGLAGCAAARGSWGEWKSHMDRVDEQMDAHDLRIVDFPRLAECGARACLEADVVDGARRMFRVARQLWADVDLPEEVERVDKCLDRLQSGDPGATMPLE